MCTSCGCGDPEIVSVELHDRILATNDRRAAHNREHFSERGVLAINLMGSPGAGKTAVLEATAKSALQWNLAAFAGDLETDRDAQRLERAGIRSLSITTGSACHLDAQLVHKAMHQLKWDELDALFIENVGNLVCPAVYDLGQHRNVVALSVTEGDDKPVKYPTMFRTADLVLITKIDLLPHLRNVSIERIVDALGHVMPEPRFIALSAESGEGMSEWTDWLRSIRVAPALTGAHAH